jgi:hypothetical protein
MNKLAGVAALAALAATAAAAQTPFPDLRGTWVGSSESIIAGQGTNHHPGASKGPRLNSVEFTLKVDKQDGRRVSGTIASARASEPIIGVLSRSGAIHFVDTDGFMHAALLAPDRLELCYLHNAGGARVASCTEMTKKP